MSSSFLHGYPFYLSNSRLLNFGDLSENIFQRGLTVCPLLFLFSFLLFRFVISLFLFFFLYFFIYFYTHSCLFFWLILISYLVFPHHLLPYCILFLLHHRFLFIFSFLFHPDTPNTQRSLPKPITPARKNKYKRIKRKTKTKKTSLEVYRVPHIP